MTVPGAKKMGRDRHVRHALGETLYGNIKKAKVLLVGAGGIGCELLKNLVMTGFGTVEIVDLDTIDLSNLNRQFLFRHEHIKKSKAMIAKETASKFNPDVQIVAHHANIKDKEFNVDWFGSFTIVFNALDNLEARRHVNRMCLAADVPLVESGTTGFEGQVQTIKKGVTECYDCNPKPTTKVYAICTIRSTPSQPIHCIVWAKSYLFTEIFGAGEDGAKELDDTEDSDNADEISQLRQEARELKEIRANMGSDEFAKLIFNKVFDKDIQRLKSVEDMWKNRKAPEALKWDEALSVAKDLDGDAISTQDQTVWDFPQNVAVFISSLRRLSKRFKSVQEASNGASEPATLSFDKDDKDTLDFVAAAANLRSRVFDIDCKSEFNVKQMAGNIIPAIATTNAMTASLSVLQALKILRQQLERAKMVFLAPRNPARVVSGEPPRAPNPDCAVCSVAIAEIKADTERAKLSDLVNGVLKTKLAYTDEISVSSERGLVYDADYDENLEKKLSDLGISGDSTITIVDEDDGEEVAQGDGPDAKVVKAPRVNLSLLVKETKIEEGEPVILAVDDLKIERRPRGQPEATNGEHQNGAPAELTSTKRKREAEDEGEQAAKKARPEATDGDIVLVGEQEQNGAILIED